ALSRFGRKTQTDDQPFSLTMLADPEQQQAADRWLQMFGEAPDTASSNRKNIIGTVKAFRAGHVHVQAREDDPLDAEAIKAFMITALNHGTNPSTAGNHATLLQVLSRFGRKTQTPDQPFSLKMLADPEQQEAADRWLRMFGEEPDTGSSNREHLIGAVKAFRAGHAQAREKDDPLDAQAINAFIITALNHGTNPSTTGKHAKFLQVLSRFGRKTQTDDQPFSLTMLADPEQQQAADRWLRMFGEAPDTASFYQKNIIGTVKAFRAGHVKAREKDDPLDAEAIKAFMITAVNHGTNPGTAGSHATVLRALSRFGRKTQTDDQPFSLTMLADPEQQQAADRWLRMFGKAPATASSNRKNLIGAVNAFRAGHVRAGQISNLNVLPIR
ncbi:hypothetical protein ACCS93_37630, partial [Rhizobium ruizarguesonis]